jgi:hypothetical protein
LKTQKPNTSTPCLWGAGAGDGQAAQNSQPICRTKAQVAAAGTGIGLLWRLDYCVRRRRVAHTRYIRLGPAPESARLFFPSTIPPCMCLGSWQLARDRNFQRPQSKSSSDVPVKEPESLKTWSGWDEVRYLVEHAVGEDGLLVEHLHGDGRAGVGVDGELDLGEGALADGPAHLVAAHPLLPPRRVRHSCSSAWSPAVVGWVFFSKAVPSPQSISNSTVYKCRRPKSSIK